MAAYVEKVVDAALETVAKTKCENGFHIKKKCFMKAVN